MSTNTTLQLGAMPDRTVPLSPGVWAVYDDSAEPFFMVGQPADLGTERIAEEGMPDVKESAIAGSAGVDEYGIFQSPGGPDGGNAIAAGESATFTFEAMEGQKLQLMTMFGPSNDWFYAFEGGLELFMNGSPIEGNVTSSILLYDAGTELDEMPGLGLTQKADHPTEINIGPPDPVNEIQDAMDRHPLFTIPANASVIRVTISSQL
jgi:hypothetical protein